MLFLGTDYQIIKPIVRVILVLLSTLGVLAIDGCTIKREVVISPGNDFSSAILQTIPAASLQAVRDLGVTLYDGRTPPTMEGIYFESPVILTKTTVPNESAGKQFANIKLRVYNQNNQKLTASLDTKEFNSSSGTLLTASTGNGSLLSGNGNFFSLFVVLQTTYTNSTTRSRTLQVYSGELTPTGIKNLQNTLLMLDDYGDPNNELIGVNTGRAFKDNDLFSEKVSTFRIGAETNKTETDTKSITAQ